ncbi:DUF6326 family protein [Pedobacter sp. KR3-3]|uniref:DUF6326 family protein n=1 Tax=Pedobacter albus TaxID=3113905 RepID=A0ABU7I520_9SPHI|nr:DUF6326 family protein [Pedobacter sp. KR3-3]MEE1944552.1 DUF6326 family protein [Pedobacter sp. KR3-3]
MNSNHPKNQQLEHFKVNIKIRLAFLWTAVMFCYVYGDFFSLFVPGRIKNLMDGHSGVGQTTPYALLGFALMMSIPALMIFLSVSLKAKANKIANIVAGLLFSLIMALILATSLDKWMLFYGYLALLEIILTAIIVCLAITWPKQNRNSYEY